MFALGALGALGAAGTVAAVRAKRAAAAKKQQLDDAFDFGDLDEPVIVTEEVVVVTEAGPYEIEMELVPIERAND